VWYEGAIAAYQPKGAASLAASYVNLANPGTHDLSTTSAPEWSASTGWGFLPANSTAHVVTTTPSYTLQDVCIIIRCNPVGSTTGGGRAFTRVSGTPAFQTFPRNAGAFYANISTITLSDILTDSVFAINKTDVYVNGLFQGSVTVEANATASGILFGNRTALDRVLNGYIMAAGFFVPSLTPAEVLAKSTAMAAL
jgi:hypothetical protein